MIVAHTFVGFQICASLRVGFNRLWILGSDPCQLQDQESLLFWQVQNDASVMLMFCPGELCELHHVTVWLLVTKSAQGCTLKRSFQLSSSSICQSSRRVAIRWADGAQPYYMKLRPRAEVREVHKEGWLHRQCSSLCCCHLDSLSPLSPTMVQAVVAIVYCLFVFLAGFFLFRIKHGFIISDLVDKPIELPSSLFCSPPLSLTLLSFLLWKQICTIHSPHTERAGWIFNKRG